MMIKVVLACDNKSYVNKLSECFQRYYFDTVDLACFTDKDALKEYMQREICDIYLYGKGYEGLEGSAVAIKLVEETPEREHQIFMYQNMDSVVRKLAVVKAELQETFKARMEDNGETKVVTFLSASGGVGKTASAVDFAKKKAAEGKKVLFLSVERVPSYERYFETKVSVPLSDIMFYLKTGKGNVPAKIESSFTQDESGVYYWRTPDNLMDLLEMKADEWKDLLQQVTATKFMDMVVVDTDIAFNADVIYILERSDRLICISDNSEQDIERIKYLKQGFLAIEHKRNITLTDRLEIINNCYTREGCR